MIFDDGSDHDGCDHRWKQVTCDRCGDTYQCQPGRDFYCAVEGDHCCEPCLLRGRRLIAVKLPPGQPGVADA